MVFSLIILVLIGAIAFFHYVQGMFSATVSAILAILASVLAVSYTEPLVLAYFTGGRYVDYAYAIVLISLFALIYLVLRLIFDKAIPGNVRLPVLMDKIGAAVMGVVAGLFATGVFALAAESLPFAESFGMYSLYPIATDSRTAAIAVQGRGRRQDAAIGVELDVDSLNETEKRSSTWIPSADLLLGLTQHLSDGGSLAGSRELASVHPDLLAKFYGQRLGQQVGDKRTALADDIKVQGVFAPEAGAKLRQHSSELAEVRKVASPERTAGPGKRFLVVRVSVGNNASGVGDLFRFSTGAVTLVAGAGQEPNREWRQYFPVGTLYNGNLLFVSSPNDPLFLSTRGEKNEIDFVFEVDTDAALARAGDGPPTVREGTFIEIKRLARLDLSGKSAPPTITPSAKEGVLRKPAVLREAGVSAPAQQSQEQQP